MNTAHPVCQPVLITMQRFLELVTHTSTVESCVAQASLNTFYYSQILGIHHVPKCRQFLKHRVMTDSLSNVSGGVSRKVRSLVWLARIGSVIIQKA